MVIKVIGELESFSRLSTVFKPAPEPTLEAEERPATPSIPDAVVVQSERSQCQIVVQPLTKLQTCEIITHNRSKRQGTVAGVQSGLSQAGLDIRKVGVLIISEV